MRHVTIELSEAQEAMLSRQVAEGEFASIEAGILALVDAQSHLWAKERLEELLLEGVRSPSLPWTPELLDDIRRAARVKR